MKKLFSLFLALTLVFSYITPTLAENVGDSKYEKAGKELKELGLLSGDTDGNLRLDENLKKQHMVVMISRIYGEQDKASKYQGINKFKDLKPSHKVDIPYITWASDKGLISGKPDGTFGIDQYVTVQEYQSVLLRGLGYLKDASNWDMIPEMAKMYGIMDELSVSASSKMNRGVMAVMTLNALRQERNGEKETLAEFLNIKVSTISSDEFKVDATAKIEGNNIYFKGQVQNTDNLWISLKPLSSRIEMKEKYSPIPLDKNGNFSYEINQLEVGEYEYRFQSGEKTTKYQSIKIDIAPFKLDSAKADNLKEIHLNFTHPVNKTLSSLPSNYSTTAGNISDVRFEEDDKKIILTLDEVMSKGTQYKLSAMKIKAESGEETHLKNVEFKAIDNTPPEIKSINQLGRQGIRIYFSEPVKKSLATNFKIDEKTSFGKVIYENNSLTLLYHSSADRLPNGEHKLMLLDVEDYGGHKLSRNNHIITFKDDDKAPMIKSISSTLERVLIEFDKDIDPQSVTVNKIYCQEAKNNKYPKSVTVVGNRIMADFSDNILSPKENSMYVLGITDYFGNKLSEIKKIEPIVDNTAPTVASFKLSDDGMVISIYYSKSVHGSDKNHYRITDEKDKNIDIKEITGSGREYKIHLYKSLPLGSNSLEIDGVPDANDRENTVKRFRTNIGVKDTEKPRILSHTGYGNNIVINFSKAMDESTVTNPSNYIMKFKGEQHKLPSSSSFIPSKDGSSVTILLAERYNNDKLIVGKDGNLSELDITHLKDITGNDTNPLIINIKFKENSTGKAKSINYYSERPGRHGILTGSNDIKIKFNMPIVYASKYDFLVEKRNVTSVTADGSDIVTIHLEDEDSTSIPSGSVRIAYSNDIKTYIDTGVESETLDIWDEIAPRITKRTSSLEVYKDQIEIPFTEDLESEGASLYRRDLEVIRLEDNKLLSEEEYTSSLDPRDNSILLVNINKKDLRSKYSIRLIGHHNKDKLSYIRDIDGNLAISSKLYFTSEDL